MKCEKFSRATISKNIFKQLSLSLIAVRKLLNRAAEGLSENNCRDPNPEGEVFDFRFDSRQLIPTTFKNFVIRWT